MSASTFLKILLALVLQEKYVSCFTIPPTFVRSYRPFQTSYTSTNWNTCTIQMNVIQHGRHESISRTTALQSSRFNSDNNDINGRDKAAIILYRTSLIVGSFSCGLSGITTNVQGLGLSQETISNVHNLSHAIFFWSILLGALAIPKNQKGSGGKNGEDELDVDTDQEGVNDSSTWCTFINDALPYLSSLTILIKYANEMSSPIIPTFDEVSNEFFISAICLREVGYFGAPYKIEAILALGLVIISLLGFNDNIGFSDTVLSGLLGLSLLVLSFGKVFEPLQDDLEPNGSAFFRYNAMEKK